jgi:hypothetical protein
MQKTIISITALVFLICSAACRKVITVDLNSASPKYVIEGAITNASGPYQVKITQTKNFSDNNTFPGVSGAVVTISDNAGNTSLLSEGAAGYYTTAGITGVPGRTYYLSVKIGNETFQSVSTMPARVPFDTLYIESLTDFGDTLRTATVGYKDPAGIKNYYRYVMYLNNNYVKEVFISNDELTDGKELEQTIFSNGDQEIKQGDSVKVEMQCIDSYVYKYFFTLVQTIGQNSAAPTNPVNNITGALGYFSAHSVEVKRIKN